VAWIVKTGDCLDPVSGLASLAAKSVDHVISDPPYEAEAHANARRAAGGPRSGRDCEVRIESYEIPFSAITEEQRVQTAGEAVRLARGWIGIFCQVEAVAAWRAALVSAGASWRRAVAWVKPDGAPQFTGDRPAQGFECIAFAWAGEGRSRWNGGGRRGVYEALVNNFGRITGERREHPTQKPLSLIEALVRDFTDRGDLVCDPFAGSGTTGVACKRLGRNFIGWEREPKWAAAASKRIGKTREQFEMFEERP
jgi:site-specific DNA-methyltransferase (adenine-specific)